MVILGLGIWRIRDSIGATSPLEKLRNEVGHRLAGARRGVLPNVVDRKDVRMIQRGGGAGFLLEPLEPFRVARELGRQHFDRDVAMQARIARANTSPIPPAPIRAMISCAPRRTPGANALL